MEAKLNVAVLVLADIKTPEDLGRVVNAMITVKEFKESKDNVKLIFDGAATQWISELTSPTHKYHSLFNQIKDCVTGVCGYCAEAFHVTDKVQAAKIHLIKEFEGHPSIRKLIKSGYQLLTF